MNIADIFVLEELFVSTSAIQTLFSTWYLHNWDSSAIQWPLNEQLSPSTSQIYSIVTWWWWNRHTISRMTTMAILNGHIILDTHMTGCWVMYYIVVTVYSFTVCMRCGPPIPVVILSPPSGSVISTTKSIHLTTYASSVVNLCSDSSRTTTITADSWNLCYYSVHTPKYF